jgi:predicted ester cyclase
MSIEQNKALMRRWHAEVWDRGEEERIPEFIAADCVHHRGAAVVPQDPAEWLEISRRWHMALPDVRNEIELLVAEGDTVTAYFRFSGTHTGPFVMGGLTVPPTGRRFIAWEVWIFRYVDGKVVESWAVWDRLLGLQQLDAAALAAQV